MDGDLERSVAKVRSRHPGAIDRDGAVLTGWSRGAFAAPVIARLHPRRWPYLVLIEANAPLSAASLRKAGVRAVALLAGELGTEIAGERATQVALERAGFPARLFVMRGVAHLYPDDIDALMKEAFDYVLAHDGESADRDAAP
jgi:pimeloyl-ACP methyl ester carboxylesterase